MYVGLKHLHTTIVTLSILLFLLRGAWLMMGSALADNRGVKIGTHITNALLLVSAFGVAWVGWNYPLVPHAWINAKVIGLIVYIVAGVIAFKGRGDAGGVRLDAFLVALAAYVYIVLVALAKSPSLGLLAG